MRFRLNVHTDNLLENPGRVGNDVDVLTSGSLGDKPVEKIKGISVYRAISLHNLLKPVTKMIWRRSKAVVAVTNSLRKMALKIARNYQWPYIVKKFLHLYAS